MSVAVPVGPGRPRAGRFAPPARLWAAAGLHAAAIVVTMAAWGATRGESHPNHQIPWIVLASCAAALSGAVNAAWLLLSRREVGARHRELSARIVALRGQYADRGALDPAERLAVGLVALNGSMLYHRPGCTLLEGRAEHSLRPADETTGGGRPCGWCSP